MFPNLQSFVSKTIDIRVLPPTRWPMQSECDLEFNKKELSKIALFRQKSQNWVPHGILRTGL